MRVAHQPTTDNWLTHTRTINTTAVYQTNITNPNSRHTPRWRRAARLFLSSLTRKSSILIESQEFISKKNETATWYVGTQKIIP